APGRPPAAPNGAMPGFESEGFEIDFDSSPQQNTRQMSAEHVEALNARSAQIDSGAAARIDAQLDDEELGDDIRSEVAAGLAHGSQHDADDDLPFDPDEARAFDAHVNGGATEHAYVAHDDMGVNGSYDPYGAEAAPVYEDTSAHAVETMRGGELGMDDIEEA